MEYLSSTLPQARPGSYLLLTILSLLFFNLYAQPSGNTTWQVSSFVYAEDLNVVNRPSEFMIFPDDSIRWIQDEGSKIYDFEILSSEGTWPSLQEDGQMIYHVTRANLVGWIKFERVRGIVSISLTFQQNGHNIMPYTFNVSNIAN